MRKLWFTVMMMVLASSLIWGAGQQATSSDVEGPVTLGVTFAYQGVQENADFDNLYYMNVLRQKFDVDFDITAFPTNVANEKINIAFAAGELKDMLWGGGVVGPIKTQALKAGSFLALNDIIENGIGWKTHPYWSLMKPIITENDGNIYTLPRGVMVAGARNAGGRIFYDFVLMEELGLEEPNTLDELYDILVAVKRANPEIIPVSGLYSNRRVHAYFMNAFGMKSDIWGPGLADHINIVDGKVVFTYNHPNYRAYLEYMKMLADQGLLDPEYTTQTNAQMVAKGQEMKYFLFSHGAPYTLVGNNENALRFKTSRPLTSDYNPKAWWGEKNPWSANTAAAMADTEYPERVGQILDWMGTLEGESTMIPQLTHDMVIESALPEGVTIENVASEPKDGFLQEPVLPEGYAWWKYINTFTSPRASNLPGMVSGWGPDSRWGKVHGIVKNDPDIPSQNFHYWQEKVLPEYFVYTITGRDLKFTNEENEVLETYVGEIASYVDEMHAKFILGVEPIANFDNYLDTLKRYGIDRITEAYQAAYERYLALK